MVASMVRRPGLLRRSWWRDEGYYSLRPRRHEPVAFWPELPDRHTTIWKVLSLLGRPLNLAPGRVYQRVVDNRVGDEVLDLRLVKVGPALPVAYLKFRPVEQRFENTNSRAMLIDPAEVLRPGELDRVAAVAVALGLDFGEID